MIKMAKLKILKQLIVFVTLIFFVSRCGQNKSSEKESASAAESLPTQKISQLSEVVGVGKVEPEGEMIHLASPAAGIVQKVYRKAGDSVKEGESLVKLDDEVELLQISKINSQLQTQSNQIDYDKLLMKEIQVKLENKKSKLLSTRNLEKKGAETSQQLDDIETEVETLKIDWRQSEIALKLAQSRLTELAEQKRILEKEAQKKVLTAPVSGLLLEMHPLKGSAIGLFGIYAELAPEGEKIVRAEVDEMFSEKLKVGQTVEIRDVGGRLTLSSGRIIFLSPNLKKKSIFSERANDQEDRRVREIKVSLDKKTSLLLNAKVECVVNIEE
jgi:multidrug efflux pump subunit AcrA (membrane-fusion protein)